MSYAIKVNGVPVKAPTNYITELIPGTDADRNLNFDLSVKGIAAKQKITVTYDLISEADFLNLLSVTWDEYVLNKDKITVNVEFTSPGGSTTIVAYFSTIKYGKSKDIRNTNYWENVYIAFVEK